MMNKRLNKTVFPRPRNLVFLVAFIFAACSVDQSHLFSQITQNNHDNHDDSLPCGVVTRIGTIRFRHWDGVSSLAFSPDGKTVASGSFDQTVRIWEWPTGKNLASFTIREKHDNYNPIYSVAFAPNGRSVGIGGKWGLWLWDWQEQKEGRLFAGPFQKETSKESLSSAFAVTKVAFSQDGKHFGCADTQGTIRVWSVQTKSKPYCILNEEHSDLLNRSPGVITFSPDNKLIAYSAKDDSIHLMDLVTLKERTILKGHEGGIEALCFSADGKILCSGSNDETLRLWNVSTGKEIARMRNHTYACYSVAFSHNGKLVISGDGVGTIRIWSLETNKLFRQLQGPPSGINCLAVSPDDQVLIVGGEDEALWLWDLNSWENLNSNNGHRARVQSISFSPDDRLLATASNDGTARLWDVRSGKQVNIYQGHNAKIRALAFAPDGKAIATAGDDGTVRIWQVTPGGKQKVILQKNQQKVYRLIYCQAGKTLVSTGADGFIRFWDPATGMEKFSIPVEGGVPVLAGSANGFQVCLGYSDHMVVLDLQDGKEIYSISDSTSSLAQFAYSPDGKMLAVAAEFEFSIYEAASGKLIQRLDFPNSSSSKPRSICFAGCCKLLGVGTKDGTIFLWELPKGNLLAKLQGGCGEVLGLSNSLDGRLLASGNSDTTALIWQIPRTATESNVPKQLSEDQYQNMWDDLQSENASRAYQAIWAFVRNPGPAEICLGKHLHPVSPIDNQSISQAIADLGNDHFSARKQASEKLNSLGSVAVPALQRRLAEKPSLQVQRQIQELLQGAKTFGPKELQLLRAIQVLEYTGTPETKVLLKRLASGAPEARATQEAQASLKRLTKETDK